MQAGKMEAQAVVHQLVQEEAVAVVHQLQAGKMVGLDGAALQEVGRQWEAGRTVGMDGGCYWRCYWTVVIGG